MDRLIMLSVFLLLADLRPVAATDSVAKHARDEYDERGRLTKTLLQDYDRFQVPAKNSHKPVNVTITMWPYDILSVNEAKSSIKFSGWLDLRWIDYNLQWRPQEHMNITHLFVPASQLWLPSVDIFYSKDESSAKGCKDCYIKIDSTGETLWGQYFSFSFPCTISVRYFPFDLQYCEMELANWYLDDQMMDLYPRDSALALDLSVFLPNVEWELLNVTVTRRREFFNYGFFPSLAYRLYIKRKPFFYITNLVIPSLIITLTAVIGFHFPSSGTGIHQEKVKMGVTAVLSIFILQLGVADKLPRTSEVVPLIGVYYACMVMILSLSIVSSAFIIVIEKQGIFGKPIPDGLQLVFLWRLRPNRHLKEPQRSISDGAFVFENHGNFARSRRQVSGNFSNYGATGQNHNEAIELTRCECSMTYFPDTNETLAQVWRTQQQLASQQRKSHFEGAEQVNNSSRRRTSKDHAAANMFEWSQAFNQTLAEIRASIGVLELHLQEQERKQRIRRDWSALADSIERISLAFFVTAAFVSLWMFFYHSWY